MAKVTFTQDNFQLNEKQEELINKVELQQKNADKAAEYYEAYVDGAYDIKNDNYDFFNGSYKDGIDTAVDPYTDDNQLCYDNFDDIAIQEAIDYFTYSY